VNCRRFAWLGWPLQSRGDVDPIAHQIAVCLLDDVAEMNGNSKFYAPLRRQAGVALHHVILHLNGAAHGADDAAKLDEVSVTGTLDDTAMMRGDSGIDEVAAQAPAATKRGLRPPPASL